MSRKENMMLAAQRLADTKRTETAKQQCLYDFEIAVDWADNNPDWISVDDELPESCCTVLVHFCDGEQDLCDYYGSDFHDYTGEIVTRNVTHWMNLPKPPTQ